MVFLETTKASVRLVYLFKISKTSVVYFLSSKMKKKYCLFKKITTFLMNINFYKYMYVYAIST